MASRIFLITKKAISEYLKLHRNTVTYRLERDKVDINDMTQILDWLVTQKVVMRAKKFKL